jgi:glycosyltransferase involved in cell wall biosynthesis
MLEKILTAPAHYPAHLHRHILQWYAMNHRHAPSTEGEQRRAVFEYVTRNQNDKEGKVHVHSSPELDAWLDGEDEVVRGWGPVPRVVGLVYQFSRGVRKRYDLDTERDYKAFACYVALSVQGALRWPESMVGPALRRILWEPAPGIRCESRIGFTRAMNHVRRNGSAKDLDPSHLAGFSQLLLLVLSDIEQGKLPGHVLSDEQYAYLAQPVRLKNSRLPLSGLLHHLTVERGLVKERDLAASGVAEALVREFPTLLARLRLPRRLREAHSEYLAPVAPIEERAAVAPVQPVVTVVGPLSHGSGLGAAARACVEAFKAARIPVEVLNRRATWGSNDEHSESGQTTRVQGDINVIHFNPDTFIENVSSFGLDQFERGYNIGVFWWETSKACFAHRLGADLVDEVWVATPYLKEIFEKVTDKPVTVVPMPVPKIADVSWATRGYFEIPEDKFTFVFTFDGFSRFTRKNPLAGLDAFQRAFPGDEGVHFVVKTQNTSFLTALDGKIYAEIRSRAKADRRITVIDETFSSNEVHGLISLCDCYVALHHSEGFGYGMAEAMRLRVPVIATDYSGNVEFATEETAWPVRCRRVPVPPGGYFYQEDGQEWADPDIDHAAQRMLEVRTDPARQVKIARAFDMVTRHYDVDSVGRTYRKRIEQIRAGLGADVDAARMTA